MEISLVPDSALAPALQLGNFTTAGSRCDWEHLQRFLSPQGKSSGPLKSALPLDFVNGL